MSRLKASFNSKSVSLDKKISRIRYFEHFYFLWKLFFYRIYSIFTKYRFKRCGSKFYIETGANIIGGQFIEIGNNFSCFKRLRIEAFGEHNGFLYSPNITIGDHVSLNYDCHIGCVNKVVIGNRVLIASRVFITDHSHGEITKDSLKLPPSQRQVISKGPVVIGDNVWIGEGAIILPNVSIGENSIIGANSVVTKSFPANSVIGGVPAKLIKCL